VTIDGAAVEFPHLRGAVDACGDRVHARIILGARRRTLLRPCRPLRPV
jgi:hypothetical protein